MVASLSTIKNGRVVDATEEHGVFLVKCACSTCHLWIETSPEEYAEALDRSTNEEPLIPLCRTTECRDTFNAACDAEERKLH